MAIRKFVPVREEDKPIIKMFLDALTYWIEDGEPVEFWVATNGVSMCKWHVRVKGPDGRVIGVIPVIARVDEPPKVYSTIGHIRIILKAENPEEFEKYLEEYKRKYRIE